MRYRYEDLYDQQFEELVIEVCAELLGPGIQPFSSGKDGGRDARFVGAARCFPSEIERPRSTQAAHQARRLLYVLEL
jgi:hypothetical protein